MVDLLPFPRIMSNKPEEQIGELVNYLIQFKETLEFAITNISTENFSSDLVKLLNELGANIENNKAEREEEVAQISTNALTISDVINSDLFKLAIKSEAEQYVSFSVNYETGHLEYNTSNGEVNNG